MKMSQIQQNLAFLDYNTGTIDGEYGRQTCHALKMFQVDYRDYYKAYIDGEWGSKSQKAMLTVIKELQNTLKKNGYYKGEIDGEIGSLSTNAAKAFQKAAGLNVTGKLNDATLRKLGMYPIARQRRNALVNAAEKYLGKEEPHGDDAIIKHYNKIRVEPYEMTLSDPWCAAFVSVAADDSNNKDIIIPSACADYFQAQFKRQGNWLGFGVVPTRGCLILYDDDFRHVGIVTAYKNGKVYTIEGNNNITGHNDGVWRHKLTNSSYYSYCLPPFWKKRK